MFSIYFPFPNVSSIVVNSLHCSVGQAQTVDAELAGDRREMSHGVSALHDRLGRVAVLLANKLGSHNQYLRDGPNSKKQNQPERTILFSLHVCVIRNNSFQVSTYFSSARK